MAVLNDSDGALVPRNGANGVNGSNGVHKANGANGTDGGLSVTRKPAMSAFTLPRSVPAKTLVNPKTVSTLAQAFNFSNIINKHSLHERELRDVEEEKLDFRSEEYMTTILNLKMSQDDKYVGYMNFRGKIANHLQAALADSDELLQSLADLTENLSVAQHEKELANEGRKAAEKVRDQLQEELNTSSCELTRARLQMIQLLRERDDESVKAQAARNLLTIRDKQIEVLQEDVTRLQKVVDSLTKKHGEAVDAFRKAQKAERQAAQEAEQQYATVQRLKREKQLLDIAMRTLEEDISKLRLEHAKVMGELTDAITLIDKYEKDNVQLDAALKLAKESAEKAEAAQRMAEILSAEAEMARQEAIEAERTAKEKRDSAEAAQRAAEVSEREKTRMYEDAQANLNDNQYILEKEIREKEVLKEQRDHAIKRATVACHYTQESIEWGQALNLINHQLFQQYEIMQGQKIKACEDKLLEERQKKNLLGETLHVKQRTLELEEERHRLLEEHRLTRADIDVLTSQFSEAQAQLETELAVMEGEVATLRVEQLGWDGERSQYLQSIAKEKSASQKAASMNTELDEKLKAAQLAQAELKEAHTAAMKERDEIEKALKDKFEADLQKREEAEKGLRAKIVAGFIEHEDKVKELQDKFQLEVQKLQDEEKALKDQRDAEIRKREEEEKTHEQQLQAERAQFDVKRQELIEQGKKNEEELRNNFAETQAAMEQMYEEREMHLKKDSGRRGHNYEHAWIQDIFLGNQRLDEQKKTNQEIYNEIGARFSTHEPLPLENIFTDKSDKKKPVVVVYNFHGDETPRILTAAADGIMKFPKP